MLQLSLEKENYLIPLHSNTAKIKGTESMNICEFLMQPELSFIDSGNMKWNQVRKPFDSSYKFQYELSMTQKFHFVFIFAREIKHISTKN